ncbi:MAG: 30S ribosome-binding factor RbfA [Pseudomonadota bacterium]
MARDYSRTDRVADYLRQELAQHIQLQMSDPRVAMVSVTDVEVSKDLGHAKVFYTVLGKDDADEAKEVTETLNRAAGFLRSQLSRDSSLRTVPTLRFAFDESVGRGRHMEDLIERAVASDQSADDWAGEP